MRSKKEQELYEKRQMLIANSLYELGVEEDVIKSITTMEMKDIPLIDIFTHMQNGLNKLAQEETKSFFLYVNKGESENYPDGKDDDTHLNPNGARLVTTIFIDALNKLKLNYFHIQ